jgi:hypothetical protein
MEENFINYNQALALKQLGFDEPCFGKYDTHIADHWVLNILPEEHQFQNTNNACIAPLKQQALRWFRDKHNLRGFIGFRPNVKQFDFHIYDMSLSGIDYVKQRSLEEYIKDLLVGTHEEAESACIDKLIEIVKAK